MGAEIGMCDSPKKQPRCGVMVFYNGVFRRRSFWRRSASASSLPTFDDAVDNPKKDSSIFKRRKGKSDDAELDSFLTESLSRKEGEKPATKSELHSQTAPNAAHFQDMERKPYNAIVPSPTDRLKTGATPSTRRVQKEMTTFGELDSVIPDYRSNVNGTLVRASSSNMMVFGYLGNIRQCGSGNPNSNSNNVLDYLPMTAAEAASSKGGIQNAVKGNIVRKQIEKEVVKEKPVVMCRALSKRLEPDVLKVMGNDEYKKGRFAEALALYEQAIVIDPDRASYRSNKSAALTGLGRLLEAVDECREAIKIEPSYCRAHHRLATLYHRLGEPQKAQNHYKLSGDEGEIKEIEQAWALQTHLLRCNEARKLRDWYTMLKEAGLAISSGADSAPQVYASKAEALLKLNKHQEADSTILCAPIFDADASTKFFGTDGYAYFLLIQAKVDMVAGRFEDAVKVAQQAARLDPSNKETGAMVKRAHAVAAARSNGNELFKASKFKEACAIYGEGLHSNPLNAILLSNRAACHFKLGQWDKAIEDCNSALNVRSSYCKARRRRAHCYIKLERWEAAIQDYEALLRETSGDEEVSQALFEAQVQLKKQRGENVKESKFGADVVVVTSNDQFRHFVTAQGISVVLFHNKSSDATKQILPFIHQLCQRHPSIHFLKVDIEDNSYVAKLERVRTVPAFKIYKNGSKVRDINDTDEELLERSIKYFTT